MSEHDERVEALAKVLEEHEERGGGWFCSCSEGSLRYGWENHLAQALLDSPAMCDLLAAERAKARAEALTDFANWWDDPESKGDLLALIEQYSPGGPSMPAIAARARADRIHPADPEETR